MLSRLTSVLQQAVEALAPSVSRHEDFVYHWKAVTNYFIDHRHGKAPIEHSNIASHLGEMLKLLVEEEAEGEGNSEGGSTGPCMEYLLQHKLLETLYTLGRTDFPPGMKQAVLAFFTKLLSRVHQPILPHINVHRAVHRLIKICGEVKAGPTEIEEIQFLCTVCSQIKMHPHLAGFFLEDAKKGIMITEPPLTTKREFGLISSLLSLSHSEDGRVAVKACEGLMLCASLPEQSAAECIANETPFCQEMANRLCQLYEKLPRKIDPADLESVQATWGLDILPDRDDSTSFLGKRHVVSFLSWLDYCDRLVAVSNPIVVATLAASVRDHFLRPIVEPSLLQASENGTMLATLYVTQCLKTICSPSLIKVFVLFLLGDSSDKERPYQFTHKLRHRLLDHCSHLSDDVTIATLKLFDILLMKDDVLIVSNLALRNLADRRYSNGGQSASANDDEISNQTGGNLGDERTSPDVSGTPDSEREGTASDTANMNNGPGGRGSSTSCDTILTDNGLLKDNISSASSGSRDTHDVIATNSTHVSDSTSTLNLHKVVNCFLTLVPEGAKSSFQAGQSGYDIYLRDAQKQFTDCKTMCRSWDWPSPTKCHADSEALATSEFYEGSFLHMLLDKLSHMLTQSYEVNLQVSSVISKLALFPHPCLHEYLLDPLLSLAPETRTIYRVLTKVVGDIGVRMKSDLQLSAKLVCVRQNLLIGETPPRLRKVSSQKIRSEDTAALEAIIVLEEFCKELAAITFVKHHASFGRHSDSRV